MARAKSIIPLSPLVRLPGFAVDEERLDQQHRKLMADINELTDPLFEGHPWSSVVAKREIARRQYRAFRSGRGASEGGGIYRQSHQHRSNHRALERQLDEIIGHLARAQRASRGDIEAALYLRSMLIDRIFRKNIAYKSHLMRSRGIW
jgi:hemerythrin